MKQWRDYGGGWQPLDKAIFLGGGLIIDGHEGIPSVKSIRNSPPPKKKT